MGFLNENAKTIIIPWSSKHRFGVLPLYINSTDVPITYHYNWIIWYPLQCMLKSITMKLVLILFINEIQREFQIHKTN